MGYSTDWLGELKLSRPLNAWEQKRWDWVHETRHEISYSDPNRDYPSIWCGFEVVDGDRFVWDGTEKTYEGYEWIKYFLRELQDWSNAYGLIYAEGTLRWEGEDRDDRGQVTVKYNKKTGKYTVTEQEAESIKYSKGESETFAKGGETQRFIDDAELKYHGFKVGIKIHWGGNPLPPGSNPKPIDSVSTYEIVSIKNWLQFIGETIMEDPEDVKMVANAPVNTKFEEGEYPMYGGIISVKKIAFRTSPENISKFAKGGETQGGRYCIYAFENADSWMHDGDFIDCFNTEKEAIKEAHKLAEKGKYPVIDIDDIDGEGVIYHIVNGEGSYFAKGGTISWDKWTKFIDNLKVGDVVANKETKTIGKVTELYDKGFWDHRTNVETDVDGYVSTHDLEPYDERVHKNYKKFAKGGVTKPRLKKGDVVELNARKWQDSNGNTYHNVQVYVNDDFIGSSGEEYGYGRQYESTANKMLFDKYKPPYGYNTSDPIYMLKDKGIRVISNGDYVNRKKDMVNFEKGGEVPSLKGKVVKGVWVNDDYSAVQFDDGTHLQTINRSNTPIQTVFYGKDRAPVYLKPNDKSYAKGGKIKKANPEETTALIGGGLMGILLGMFYR